MANYNVVSAIPLAFVLISLIWVVVDKSGWVDDDLDPKNPSESHHKLFTALNALRVSTAILFLLFVIGTIIGIAANKVRSSDFSSFQTTKKGAGTIGVKAWLILVTLAAIGNLVYAFKYTNSLYRETNLEDQQGKASNSADGFHGMIMIQLAVFALIALIIGCWKRKNPYKMSFELMIPGNTLLEKLSNEPINPNAAGR